MTNRREALSRTLLLSRYILGQDGATDEAVDQALAETTVTIAADAQSAASLFGQGAITTLASLVLAMGCNLRTSFNDVPLAGWQPPLSGPSLISGLTDLGSHLIPGAGVINCSAQPRDLEFLVGSAQPSLNSELSWRLQAGEWWGGTARADSAGNPWIGDFKVGSAIAAAVAAPEVFKHALRLVAQRRRLEIAVPELLQAVPAARVQLSGDADKAAGTQLGRVDFVSGGAITNAALYVLYRINGLGMTARIFEPECVDTSNLNRYVLCTDRDVGKPKADVLAYRAPSDITIEPSKLAVTGETLPTIRPMAPTVAVGTDNVPTRWLVQSEWPDLTIVGATAEFTTITSAHRYPGPCAGCFHPQDDEVNVTIPTVSFVSFWAGLMVASRLMWAAQAGSSDYQSRALELWPLRLDLADSQWWHPIQADRRCPVHCPASLLRAQG